MADRAFAVVPHPLPRETAISPRSADWTLYRAADLAALLGLPVSQVEHALERTGFSKAVRIREEIIRWKERLRKEERDLAMRQDTLDTQRRQVSGRLKVVREQLENTRNLLRLPREDGAAKP